MMKSSFFLNNSDDSICARLNQSQMNRILTIEKTDKIKHWNKIAATIALTIISTANYSNTIEDKKFKTELNFKALLETKENITSQTNLNDSISKIIKGKVVEDGWDSYVKARISIKGTKIKFDTDDLGNFEFSVPDDYKLEDITLLIEPTGLEDSTEVILNISELPKYDLIIVKNPVAIGTVVIIRQKKWWQFWIKRKSYR